MSPATTTATAEQTTKELVHRLQLHELVPSPTNPRKHFDAQRLDDLADSIRAHGVLSPILVRPLLTGATFEIVAGERRFRAGRLAGLTAFPAIVRELSDQDVLELQLIENVQRDDLEPLEEAKGYRALIDNNPSKYSAAYIADRIGRSEKFVWDRMKLLDLIPEVATLLEAERILVGHAELLAKLKPADQRRAIAYDDRGFGRETGLWRHEATLPLSDDDPDERPTAKNLYRGLKPITVKELEVWIARHVRFDAEHMAQTAPLDFGATAEHIATAAAQPGRGRKVIAITRDYRVDDDAKDPSERTYGSQSWKRADGQETSKTCEHSVLGVFVAGAGYGSALQVCVARDRCQVHFAKEMREREKNAKLRASGQGAKAAQREQKQQDRWKLEREKRERERKTWEALKAKAIAAVAVHCQQLTVGASLVKKVADVFVQDKKHVREHFGDITIANLLHVLAFDAAVQDAWSLDSLARGATTFGFDAKAWAAKQAKAETSTAAETKKARVKPAKKAKAKR